jgi:ABC-type sugar transport system ATPase subunit
MADRIAVMRAGKVEQVATPDGLYSTPANVFIASFIGTPQMNLIEAELISVGAPGADGWVDARFRALGEEIGESVRGGVAKLPLGGKVTLGVRPRSFEFRGLDTTNALHAVVDIIEPMGAETLAHLVEGGQDLRCVVPYTTELSVGERVSVRAKRRQLHVFNSAGLLVE